MIQGKSVSAIALVAGLCAGVGSTGLAQEGKYTLKVPGGLAFSEFRGYESWQVVATSQNDKLVAVILANPAMIDAYLAGIPGNGKPFPDGAMMAKIHWKPKRTSTSRIRPSQVPCMTWTSW